jgi:hypothetical protein
MNYHEQHNLIFSAINSRLGNDIQKTQLGFDPEDESYDIMLYSKQMNRSGSYVELSSTEVFSKWSGMVKYELKYLDISSSWNLQLEYSHGEEHLDEIIKMFYDFFAIEDPSLLQGRLESLKTKTKRD